MQRRARVRDDCTRKAEQRFLFKSFFHHPDRTRRALPGTGRTCHRRRRRRRDDARSFNAKAKSGVLLSVAYRGENVFAVTAAIKYR